jgi:alkylhydroperoxidase family enzyme
VSAQVKQKEDAVLGGDTSSLSAREALAVELAERIAGDPHSVTSGFWDTLKGEFSDDELVELTFACSIFNWGNKFNITMQLDTDGTTYPAGMEYREVEL